MTSREILICILVMALVTYIPRVLPLLLFRKPIESKFILDFLDYIPYTVLGAITFPGIIYATGNYATAVAGTITAIFLAFRKQNLVVVAIGAIVAVYIAGMIFG